MDQNFGKIVEQYFVIGENMAMTKLLKNSFADNWSEEYIGQNGYVLFLDLVPRQVLLSQVFTGTLPKPKDRKFIDHLSKIDYSNFSELLMLVSAYLIMPYRNKEVDSEPTENEFNAGLDSFLKTTRGRIVYHHQLETLYIMATGSPLSHGVEFRKNISKKLTSAFEDSKSIELFGTTLFDILSSRMQFSFTCEPKYYQAYRLYQFLQGNAVQA